MKMVTVAMACAHEGTRPSRLKLARPTGAFWPKAKMDYDPLPPLAAHRLISASWRRGAGACAAGE
jgi:hypothetical protein